MKDHKVRITRNFNDLTENVYREIGKPTEIFKCTKERYEYMLSKGVVKLIEVEKKEEPKQEVAKKEIEEKPKKKTTKKKTKIDNK